MHKITLAALLAALLGNALPALAEIKVGVIASSTGPTAAVGIPQKNTAALLPAEIAGQKVEYIVLDDASDPTHAVTNVKKLLSEHKVDALIGPTTTPAALAMLDFVAEAKTPLLTTVGSSAIILPLDDKKKWVFKTTQNDDLISEAVLAHMTAAGIKTLGFIGFNDPYGENWFKVFTPLAEKARHPHRRQRTLQPHRLVGDAAGAQADFRQAGRRFSSPPPAARPCLPQAGLLEKGYKGRVYQTHGVATQDFIRLGGKNVEGTLMAGGPKLVVDDLADSNPIKPVAQHYIKTYEARFGVWQRLDLRRQHLGRRPAVAESCARGAQEGQAGHPGVPCGVA